MRNNLVTGPRGEDTTGGKGGALLHLDAKVNAVTQILNQIAKISAPDFLWVHTLAHWLLCWWGWREIWLIYVWGWARRWLHHGIKTFIILLILVLRHLGFLLLRVEHLFFKWPLKTHPIQRNVPRGTGQVLLLCLWSPNLCLWSHPSFDHHTHTHKHEHLHTYINIYSKCNAISFISSLQRHYLYKA